MNRHGTHTTSAYLTLAIVLAIVVALVTRVEGAVPASRKCAAAKVKATASKAAAKLACHRRAILKGIDVDPTCLANAEAKFTKDFDAHDAKGGLITTGDADDLEATVDGFAGDVVTALAPEAIFATPTPTIVGTPGPTATPEPTPTCDSPLSHSNGLGQTYLDCHPLGTPGDGATYSLSMATEARAAWLGLKVNGTFTCGTGPDAAACIFQRDPSQCAMWCYTNTVAGYVRLNVAKGGACQCPSSSDLPWN